ncbi:hypothetical protein ACFRAQ_34820 [Nocardia sp. NPDC056611]|uniref:hypothetical protein n=1 Tax=Nocardia sp. NPDC056611 TaxID=3345877 RepID=UPI003672A1B8
MAAANLKRTSTKHVVQFEVREGVDLRLHDPAGLTVAAAEFAVTWTDDDRAEGWRLSKVDVVGPRVLKAGDLGKPYPIDVYDLEQFPQDVRDEINANSPTGSDIPSRYALTIQEGEGER